MIKYKQISSTSVNKGHFAVLSGRMCYQGTMVPGFTLLASCKVPLEISY